MLKWIYPKKSINFWCLLRFLLILMWDISGFFSRNVSFWGEYDQVHTVMAPLFGFGCLKICLLCFKASILCKPRVGLHQKDHQVLFCRVMMFCRRTIHKNNDFHHFGLVNLTFFYLNKTVSLAALSSSRHSKKGSRNFQVGSPVGRLKTCREWFVFFLCTRSW